MFDYKILLGILSLAIGVVSYSFYFHGILKGKVRPDGASWFIWAFLAAIAFFAQIKSGAAAGAWITAFTAVMCLLISVLAFYRGHRGIKTIDWISLLIALAGVGLWLRTNNPLLAVWIVIAVGAIGFVPTFLKSFYKPKEEETTTFALNASKFLIAFFALGSLDPAAWLYPAAMVLMNGSLAALIFFRR